jgi:hypothetical protein
MTNDDEFFGTPERIALSRRSANLWRLLGDNPRYPYYGRLVSLSEPGEDAADILIAMAELKGAAMSNCYPANGAAALYARLEASGMGTDRHEHFRGGEQAFAASRGVLQELSLPNDLNVQVVDAGTPRGLVAEIAELGQSCGVMPVPGAVMRGLVQKGICLVATDRDGRAVATASSYMNHHPASSRAKDVFWGALATREDRRGQRIAFILGAQAIVHMWERHGARGFITGVRADNSSSRMLCEKLGVCSTEWIYAHCIDREVFGGGSITK